MVKKISITVAKAFCEKENYQFTQPREKVLNVLLNSQQPMGAYDVLSALTTNKYKPNPPTIYRAIDFWLAHGFIHKIMSLNAYVACTHTHDHHQVELLICDTCKDVQETHLHLLSDKMTNQALHGFAANKILTEIHGVCYKCQR